jgi:hypothetical protein
VNLHNREKFVGEKSGGIKLRVSRAKFDDDAELTIADDFDLGCDPYNSTGRHVIMKPKVNLED